MFHFVWLATAAASEEVQGAPEKMGSKCVGKNYVGCLVLSKNRWAKLVGLSVDWPFNFLLDFVVVPLPLDQPLPIASAPKSPRIALAAAAHPPLRLFLFPNVRFVALSESPPQTLLPALRFHVQFCVPHNDFWCLMRFMKHI